MVKIAILTQVFSKKKLYKIVYLAFKFSKMKDAATNNSTAQDIPANDNLSDNAANLLENLIFPRVDTSTSTIAQKSEVQKGNTEYWIYKSDKS